MLLMTYGLIKSLNQDPSAVPSSSELKAPDGTSLSRELHA
jgi:hypothetical protein